MEIALTVIRNETKQLNKTDRFALRWAEFVLKNRLKTILFAIIVFVVLAAGLMQIQVSHNYRVFFSDKNPDLLTFEKFEETYTKNDNFLFVVKPKSGTKMCIRDSNAYSKVSYASCASKIAYSFIN